MQQEALLIFYHLSNTGPVFSAVVGFGKDKTLKLVIAAWNCFPARPDHRGKQLLFHIVCGGLWLDSVIFSSINGSVILYSDFSFSLLFILYLSKALHSCAKEHTANAESSFRKENVCFRVFLSCWKRPLLHWQRLSAGKFSLCRSWLQLLRPPVLSFPPPHHPLLGWSSCLQAAWWERSGNSSVVEKNEEGGLFLAWVSSLITFTFQACKWLE